MERPANRSRSRNSDSWKDERVSLALAPKNASAFLILMSDCLRLREETLAMAFVYTNRYFRYLREDPSAEELLDEHTLSLASLSLATKATESPRRLREFLLPAYEVLNPAEPPLTFPSMLYDSLRTTLVTAELLLLRILRFDLRLALPFDYLPGFLRRVLALEGTDHLDYLGTEEREESNVVDVKDTSLGRAVWSLASEAARSYRLVNLFPARTVAAACLWACVEERGMGVHAERQAWVRKLTGERVAFEDFEEALEDVLELRR